MKIYADNAATTKMCPAAIMTSAAFMVILLKYAASIPQGRRLIFP